MSFLRPALGWKEVLALREEMRRIGALSPAMAKREPDLPELVRSDLMRFVELGVIQADPPGAYYLSEARVSSVLRMHVLKAVSFWFLVVIVPVVILQLSNSRAPTP